MSIEIFMVYDKGDEGRKMQEIMRLCREIGVCAPPEVIEHVQRVESGDHIKQIQPYGTKSLEAISLYQKHAHDGGVVHALDVSQLPPQVTHLHIVEKI